MFLYIVLIAIVLAQPLYYYLKDKTLFSAEFNYAYFCFLAIVLVIFSGLRGNFTSDYDNYVYLFNFFNKFSLKEIFNYQFGQELGYVLLSRLIGVFTQNSVYLMIVTSSTVIVLFFKEIKRSSVNAWMSILLFITIGQYYTSFNLIRQIMAASIIFSGSKYLYERNMKKYILVVIVASLFHKTALIMIPFYFILDLKFDIKKIISASFILVVSIIFMDDILLIIRKYLYSIYQEGSYGMTGFNFKNIVLPICVLIFVLLHTYKLDFDKNSKVNIWYNSIIFYAFFSLIGLKVQMIERISHYFAPYAILLIPYIIFKQKDKRTRITYISIAIVFAIVYNYLVLEGTGYEPYYFIWSV